MKKFLDDNFLLQTRTAEILYHDHAKKMPIIDYHCHLDPKEIAQDKKFANLTQIWLYGDHYKWRAMRTNGVEEKYCTGNASDYEKFEMWANTVPNTLRNPLYHWTHLELKTAFGINKILCPSTAKEIYEEASAMLQTDEFSTRNIIRKYNVRCICTTDDPVDSLKQHKKIKKDGFEVKVLPAWRPDKSVNIGNAEAFNKYIDNLSQVTGTEIIRLTDLLQVLGKRHKFFHKQGCRLSDHGLETLYAEDYKESEIKSIFNKVRGGNSLDLSEIIKFKSFMLYELGIMDYEKGWVQQYHFGALRNNNTRFLKDIGPDTGFDSIGDFEIGLPLSRFLDKLDRKNKLARTILYNLNPRDNELVATMTGNFQDGSVPGKIQFGSGWWFMDQKDGMEKQMNTLSNLGLLSRFIGMLTDSRSFLSYARHEYFRRILCNLIGNDVESGLAPDDMQLLGQMVENICYNNAKEYFDFGIE